MNIEITGRHFNVSDALRDYAIQKASKLTRFYDGIQRIQIIVSSDGNDQLVELIVSVNKGQTIVANERHESIYASVDLASDKAHRQLTRLKDKIQSHRTRKGDLHPHEVVTDLGEEDDDAFLGSDGEEGLEERSDGGAA